ncbi:MAG: LPS export ABC transporter permease LptG [Polaromonas sp.]|nr:LPS export ABC transporter permease LptG [Polaromonas sp.]
MKTIRKLIYREVITSIFWVTLGFLSLFLFFDLVDELPAIGKSSSFGDDGQVYLLRHALLYVSLQIPNHLYELLPISVLIGTIFVMARLAQSSEFTILRTSGLGPWRALRLLLVLGGMFVVLSFAVGDYLAPMTDRGAQLLKAKYQGRITIGQTGAWLKEKQTYSNSIVNVRALTSNNEMHGVRIFEFDNKGLVISMTEAASAQFREDNAWLLKKTQRTDFQIRPSLDGAQKSVESANVSISRADEQRWPTDISAEMVSVALLKPDRMATYDLFNYVQHLKANGQTAQRYEIEFWKKVFYPLSCLVMVFLALPFAYLHFRSGSVTSYVFGGVMIGISFFLLNNVFGYIGNLQSWQPWLAAAAPGMLYTVISLGAFGWLVLRR